jgi:hypothetical protein
MSDTLIITIAVILVIGLFTNGFGLLDHTYKGTWVKVDYVDLSKVAQKLKAVNAFLDSDGCPTELEMNVKYADGKVCFYVKIPKHVFHRVEYDVVLRELGINSA